MIKLRNKFFQLIYTFLCFNLPGRDMEKFITSIVSRPFHRDTHQFSAQIIHNFPNLSCAEVLEWISNSVPYYIPDVITYPCWD